MATSTEYARGEADTRRLIAAQIRDSVEPAELGKALSDAVLTGGIWAGRFSAKGVADEADEPTILKGQS